MTFPFDPLRDVPFSISCLECDCDSPGSYEEAIAAGWTEITYEPNGMMENFFGYCPEHRQTELESPMNESPGNQPPEVSG